MVTTFIESVAADITEMVRASSERLLMQSYVNDDFKANPSDHFSGSSRIRRPLDKIVTSQDILFLSGFWRIPAQSVYKSPICPLSSAIHIELVSIHIHHEGLNARRKGCELQVTQDYSRLYKSISLLRTRETMKGGVLGGLLGVAVGAGGVSLASRRFPGFRGLTIPFRAFMIVSTGTFACKFPASINYRPSG